MLDAARKIAAAIAKTGETVVLRRRVSSNPDVFADVSVTAVVRGYQPQELVGGIQQGDKDVIIGDLEIAAAGWPGPPRVKDLVVIRGVTHSVQGVDTLQAGSATVRHNLTVRG